MVMQPVHLYLLVLSPSFLFAVIQVPSLLGA